MSDDPCKNYKPKNETDPNFIVPYGQLTFDSEGHENVPGYHSRKPHLPLNSASGVTIGRGYDVGKRTKHEVRAHLTSAGIAANIVEELVHAAGKWGSYESTEKCDSLNIPSSKCKRDAYLYWKKLHRDQTTYPGKTNEQVLKSLEISKESQKKLFEIIYPIYEADVVRWIYRQASIGPKVFNGVVDWSHLDPRIKVILVDFKYRGDFFGRERTYTGQRLVNLRKLHKAIRENSTTRDDAKKIATYDEFKQIVSDATSFPEIVTQAEDRFCARRHFLQNAPTDQPMPLSLDSSFTFEQEEPLNQKSAYVPVTHDESGIVIGRGFNLRTRHCYKARALRFRSHSFPREIDRRRNEIVRPKAETLRIGGKLREFYPEIKLHLEAAHIPDTKISKILPGREVKGAAAEAFLEAHPDFPTLTAQEQKDLFELAFPCYVSDAILLCNNPKLMKKYNVSCVNWARLDYRIKTVLVDLCFTGDFNFVSRKFLQKHIANNDVDGFKKALGHPSNWTKAKFRWNPIKSSLVAVPPTNKTWTSRFKARFELLNTEVLPLIRNSGSSRSLSTLEPGTMCSIDDVNHQINKEPLMIPELLKITWESKLNPEEVPQDPSSQPERFMRIETEDLDDDNAPEQPVDDDEDPDPLDPEEGSDDDETPAEMGWFKELVDKDFDIGDIYFPHPTASYFIERVPSKPTQARLLNAEEEHPVKVGYRLRYRHQGDSVYKYLAISAVDGPTLTLEKPIKFEELEPRPVEFDIPFFLPLNKMEIGNLLGDTLPAIDSVISSANDLVKNLKNHVKPIIENEKLVGIEIPLKLTLFIPRKESSGKTKKQSFDFYWNVRFRKRNNEWFLDDKSKKFFLRFPYNPQKQLIDFGIFTLVIPSRTEKIDKSIATEKESDAYIDLEKREIGFTFQTMKKEKNENVEVYFPGGMSEEKNFADAAKKRFLLELERFDFDESESGFFRLNPQGISIKAKVSDRSVSVQDKATEGLLKDIEFKPLQKSGEFESRIHILDNNIKEASLFAKMLLPGFKSLEASVTASLKQKSPGEVPTVVAGLQLERSDQSALAKLDMSGLQMQLDAIRMSLEWTSSEGIGKWKFDAFVDGQISLASLANILPDLKDLKKFTAIKIENLNLKNFNLPNVSTGFQLSKPAKFDILDGLFSCQFDDLGIDWGFEAENNEIKSLSGALKCERCSFRFNRPNVLDVEVQVGGLHVRYQPNRFDIKLPSAIGINVKLGPAVHFAGEFGWVEDPDRRYFFASGSVRLEGFPEFKALLKFGSVRKNNGEQAINMVIYAETEIEMELFPGVVLKKIGGGVGVNNRLKAIDTTPNETEIIEKIDTIKPELESSWTEVKENGLYVSIVASALLASNRGPKNSFNAYIMRLIFSLDTNLDIVAAGKLWLASSVGYLDKNDHKDRPALVGALVLSPRQQRLGVELRSRQNPAIESNVLLRKILSKTTTQLAFRLTPELVDYHLKEISYRDVLLGVHVGITGHYRIAAFRRALLAKAGVGIVGHFNRSFRVGPGGFSCSGNLNFHVEYGGLLSAHGIDLYGMVSASLGFQVSAFIRIGFSISFKIFGKRISKSWYKTFRVNLSRVQLGFHGAVALSNGSLGFDGTVSISVSICGYGLSISPHLSFNTGVISSVREKVAAFERLLDEYGSASHSAKFLDKSFHNKALMKIPLSLIAADPEALPDQKWLHYTSQKKRVDGEVVTRHAYLPSPESEWFTPLRDNTVENPDENSDEVFKNDVKKIAVGAVGNSLKVLRIAPSNQDVIKVWVKDFILNQWKEKSPVVLSGSPHQNIWYIQSIQSDEKSLILTKMPDTADSDSLAFESAENIAAGAASLFKPRLLLYTPWLDSHAIHFGLNIEKTSAVRNLFLESTLDQDSPRETPESEIDVIYDPRVESPSREFMSQEAQMLPEDILSAFFKPYASSADLNSTSRDELAMIEKYEELLKRLALQEKHHILDLDSEHHQQQTQAQVTHTLISDLNETSLEEERIFHSGTIQNEGETTEIYGLIYEEPERAEEETLFVQRGVTCDKVEVVSPDKQALVGLKEKLSLLKIRQDYVANPDDSGKILLSLPIKLRTDLFTDRELSQIGSFRLYRTTHESEELSLVADRIQPKFWKYRERREISSEFVDYDGKGSLNIGNNIPAQDIKGYDIEIALDNGTNRTVFLYNRREKALTGNIEKLTSGKYFYSITLVSKKLYYLVEPYLYRDEIPLKNRSFELSDSSDRAFVDYYLELMPTGDNENATIKKDPEDPALIFWNREYLHIPEKETLPDQLSVVFSVKSLDLDQPKSEKGKFMILEGENLLAWNQKPDQFEIWVKEIPLQQTGFYAGEADFAKSQASSDHPFLEDLDAGSPFESTDGKHRVNIEPEQDDECYKIASAGIFRKDYSYQFYIGLKGGHSEKIIPMRHFLVKSFPKSWDQPPKLRAVQQIEWIPEGIYTQVSERQKNFQSVSQFLANGIYQFERNFIGTQFNCSDSNIGGVETFFIDQDEPGFIERQLCEVQGEHAFAESKKEFRDASSWQVPHWAMAKNHLYSNNSSIFDSEEQKLDLISIYYTADSLLVNKLTESTDLLIEFLAGSSYHWKEAYGFALNFFKHIARFEKSPLNIDSPLTITSAKEIKESLTHLLLGTDSTDKNMHLEHLNETLAELEKTLEQEDQSDSNSIESAKELAYTRNLLSVIRRRLSIVSDLQASKDPKELPSPRSSAEAHMMNTLLPSLGQWIQILSEYPDQIRGDHTKKLTGIFLDQKQGPIEERVNQTKKHLIDKLKDFKKHFIDLSKTNVFLQALTRVVPLAKDLTKHLDELEKRFRIQKSMHHSLNIDTMESPHQPVADIQLKAFIPDSLRLLERKKIEIDDLYPSQSRFILPFFNLMEYLGFATDIHAVTEFETPLKQSLLVKHLNETLDKENTQLPFILRGIASNSARFKEDLDPFAFVKIALIPQELFKRDQLDKTLEVISQGRQVIVKDAADCHADDCYIIEVEDPENGYQAYQNIKAEKKDKHLTLTLNRKLRSSLKLTLFRYKLAAFEKLLKHRGIEPAQARPYRKYFTHVAFLLDQFSRQATENTIPEIYLEGVSKRWVTVPAKGGVAQAVWEAPDRFGHRYQVCMRTLSRYEPLINWQIGRHDSYILPDFETLAPNLRLVRLKPIEYGVNRQNAEQMLLTYQYPHPSKAFFSYQLSVDAARALKNQTASVRSGYKGCDLVFHHELIDDPDAKIQAILSSMRESQSPININAKRIKDYDESLHKNVPEPQVRLFDHERLMKLTDLQYYHRFFMHVRTLYDSHSPPEKTPRSFPAISATVQPSNLYTFEQEVVQEVREDDLVYHFTLYLSRHLDHLTELELAKEPHSLTVAASPNNAEDRPGPNLQFKGHDIPDLTSVYHLFWRVDKRDGSGSYYIPVTTLHMPWSEDHGSEEIAFPRLRDTNSKFIIESVGPQVLGKMPRESESESKVPIEFYKIDETSDEYEAEARFFQKRTEGLNYEVPKTFYAYKVRFSLRIAKKDSVDLDLYHDSERFALQLSRKQALADKIEFNAEATSGVDS